MAEDRIIYKDVALTTDDAIAFLTHVAPSGPGPCPICSTINWGINFTPGDGQYVELTTRPQKTGDQVYGIAVYLVSCQRCGYSRPHTISSLYGWKVEQVAAAQQEVKE